MFFRQFNHHEPIAAASYLVGCVGEGVGAVVDPVGDVDVYRRLAAETGMEIRYVVDTHVHADHRTGARELSWQTGAAYVLHADSGAEFEFLGVHEGDDLDLGNVSLRVLHTPGHTPEHISLLGTDATRGPEPWFVLTGHTLMVGDLGRTELASSAKAGARSLFHSTRKLKALPDHLEIFPGAFAGSVCGRTLSGKPSSTIGFERRFNAAFQIDDEAAFVEAMTRDVPPKPPHAEAIRAFNLGRSDDVPTKGVALQS